MSDFWCGIKHGFNHGMVQDMYAMFGACPFPFVSNPYAVNFTMPNLCGNFSLYPEFTLQMPSASCPPTLNFDCSLDNIRVPSKNGSVFDYMLQKYQSNNSDFILYSNPSLNWTKTNNTGNQGTETKAPYWYEMTDDDMKKLYGNYDYDVTILSDITAEQINQFIETKYPNSSLRGQGQVFLDAQERYGISALVMLGICGAETTYGTRGNARNGKYNIVNIQREGYNGTGERWKQYTSAEECIMDLAKKLKNNFVDSPGKGKVAHLTKLYQIGPKYCPARETPKNANWAKNVQSEIDKISQSINA